jgi:nitrite reductase (cytochrome c-552)
MRETWAILTAVGTGLLVVGGVALFALLRLWTVDISEEDVDPQRWAARYPRHYEMTMKTRLDSGKTAFGGSTRYDRLLANPFRKRAFAGHAFELEYNSARGHYYCQIDQRDSRRTREKPQPAACVQCHAAEGPRLVAKLGWEDFHRLDYDDLKDQLHHGTSCLDCHAADTMALRVSRPAFIRGMQQLGIDVTQASRQELRTFVCAQCHLEYYFRGEIRELVPPWSHGLRIEDIERHFDEQNFSDWLHAETKAPLIKIQHPEFELFSTGTHARQGVACADCHMPTFWDGGLKLTDHWIRSPLTNIQNACLNCHKGTEQSLRARAEAIQGRTVEQMKIVESAISDLMDALVAAQKDGGDAQALEEARRFHRRAQLRWDFIDAENSTGFHSPHETARILLQAVDLARRGERRALEAVRLPSR